MRCRVRSFVPAAFWFLSSACCLLCSVAWPQVRPKLTPPKTEIRGQVRYPEGPAVGQGITITLESDQGGVVAQAQTESQGKFVFSQIPQAVYVVKLRERGYREVSRRVDLTMGPTAYLIIELQPLPRQTSSAVPPKGLSSLVSAQELVVPEDARREFERGKKLLLEDKDPAGSIVHFRKAVQLYSSYAQAYLLTGTADMDLNKWKEAEAALEKAIALDQKLAAAHLALGTCYNQEGNFAAAEKPLLQGLQLNPDAAEGHYELGRAYWALGRWPEAEAHAREAAKLRSDFGPVHVLLGNIMLRKRDAPAALQEFKEYLSLDPKGLLAAPTRDLVVKIEKALAASR